MATPSTARLATVQRVGRSSEKFEGGLARRDAAFPRRPRRARRARAAAALNKGLMRRTAEDVITFGQAPRLVAATLLARKPAAVPFILSSLYAAALSWADGGTA